MRLLARRPCLAAALAAVALAAACGSTAFGRVFISPVKNSAGRAIGVVIDFVKTDRFADKRIVVELRYRGVSLVIPDGAEKPVTAKGGEPDGYTACVIMPDTHRLTLLSRSGELSTGARVRVVARERIATGNTPGCTGPIIDDAVWPAGSATLEGQPGDEGVEAGVHHEAGQDSGADLGASDSAGGAP